MPRKYIKRFKTNEEHYTWRKEHCKKIGLKTRFYKGQKFCGIINWKKGMSCCNKGKTLWKKGQFAKERAFNWKGGISFEPYPPSFDQQLKEKIRVRDNFKCQLCGIPELECNANLCIHHIDYDKGKCIENNLICLCLSCNIKVNYNREYWKIYFQKKIGDKNESYIRQTV